MALKPIGTVPVYQPLQIYRGATLYIPFTIRNALGAVDLTGYIGRAQLRKKRLSVDATAIPVVWPDAANGRVALFMTATQTAALACGETPESPLSKYAWDFEVESPTGHVYPIRYGDALVYAEVTR